MKLKKKSFDTNKGKIIDRLFIIFILIINIITFINGGIEETIYIFKNSDDFLVRLGWIIFIIMVIFVKSLPYLAIYYGFKYTIKKYNKSRRTFDVVNDIDYYRDIFKDVSPATMSLIMDLELEKKKDIGAMKLYYELNDIYLYEKDGGVYLNNPNNVKLNKSDDILLNCFFKKKNSIFVLNEWKENVITENINNNLIRRKNNNEKKKVGCGLFVLLNILSIGYIIFAVVYLIKNIHVYNLFVSELEMVGLDNIDVLNFLASNPEYFKLTFILLLTPIFLLFGFWNIISSFIHLFVSSMVHVKDKFKRTPDGNVLAEKLYGMKNFIHNFSNLDDATKEHLVLWKEFLIYAVVLEENDIVLKEIGNIYHTDISNYKNYDN